MLRESNYALRPTSLTDLVGQPALVARLRILIGAAKARAEPVPHLLLQGPPGLGKTTLANIIANEIGTTAHIVMGPGLEKPADIHAVLGRISRHDVVFIDEVHRLPNVVAESIYPAMEDFRMVISLDCKTHTRPVAIDLPPFTLLGATTEPGLLEGPMRDRFGPPLIFRLYDTATLVQILQSNASKLRVGYDADALELIAARSRGTPRIANHLLRFCRDVAQVQVPIRQNGHIAHVTLNVAEQAIALQGIDSAGLNQADRDYLTVLNETFKGGPAGAQALAATLGVTPETVASVTEPFMLAQGMISRTPRGRCITDKGKAHLIHS